MKLVATFTNGEKKTFNTIKIAAKALGCSRQNLQNYLKQTNKYVLRRGKNKGTLITIAPSDIEYILQVKHGIDKGEYWYDDLSTLLNDLGISKNDTSVLYRIRSNGLYNDSQGNRVIMVER